MYKSQASVLKSEKKNAKMLGCFPKKRGDWRE
jgi:hypothetical protein